MGSSSGGERVVGSSATASNANDDLFFQRNPLFLPRRNHTIGAGTTPSRRRLNTHFQFPSQGPTSPGQNSLSAITGGRDIDDDEWEKMIKSRETLVPGEVSKRSPRLYRWPCALTSLPQDDHEELSMAGAGESTASRAWKADSSNLLPAAHRRFPSQPTSVPATSPFLSGSHSPISSNARENANHQRSESAHVSSLQYGPFASAGPLSSLSPEARYGQQGDVGLIRRHQSLNNASGRAMASRMQASTRLRKVGSDEADSLSSNDRGSPAFPYTSPPGPQTAFGDRGVRVAHEGSAHPSSSTLLSSSLMDAHARLSRMSIQPTVPQPIPESSVDSSTTAMTREAESNKMKLPSLITNREVLERSAAFNHHGRKEVGGPASASAYVPPIGHGHQRRDSSSSGNPVAFFSKSDLPNLDANKQSAPLQGPYSAMPASNPWSLQAGKHPLVAAREESLQGPGPAAAASSIHQVWHSSTAPATIPPSVDNMALSIAMLQQRLLQQQPTASHIDQHQVLHENMHATALFYGTPGNQAASLGGMRQAQLGAAYPDNVGLRGYPLTIGTPLPPFAPAPSAIDPGLASLIAAKGYNPSPSQFDLSPAKVRFFVIKSFTEDDVQRSLKFEIWASTDKGNQRLDKAFKESLAEAGPGGDAAPIYLFFSVNASGHFCGMAQMMTALDYDSTSNVWVQEGKWKGTFRVRWIYVKDVPNTKLRHIRLTNTVDCKPVTQSRDTQELPTDGGKEMLRIMAEFQSKTTLLQDWLFYEQQALQRQQRDGKQWAEAAPFPSPAANRNT